MTHITKFSPRRGSTIDSYIGVRIRDRRVLLGLSQADLAEKIGVTYQQAHKYERGTNRITAGRLYLVAKALQVDMDYFLEGYTPNGVAPEPVAHGRMFLDLSENFANIKCERQKQIVTDLARALANS